ncbi:hypothetical protein [Trichormus variabilis]|uniref:hypothetical protein n=1 Tax=Anabaena variabilis TaxID=264691 RepID=UPI0016249F89|nr:hypothetical protein [Trichormus variabilis]MBC1257774.1 hypothetical protein [Trichormus variabilis V5]
MDNLRVRLFLGAERIKERSLGNPKQATILISVSKKASSNSIGNHPHRIIRWHLFIGCQFHAPARTLRTIDSKLYKITLT